MSLVSPTHEKKDRLFERSVISRSQSGETSIQSDVFRALWNGATVPAEELSCDVDVGVGGAFGSIGYTEHGTVVSSYKSASDLAGRHVGANSEIVVYAVNVYTNA